MDSRNASITSYTGDEDLSSLQRLDSGLATPSLMIHSNHSYSAQRSRSDIGLDAELAYQEKLRHFKEYMNYCGFEFQISTRQEDADDRYIADERGAYISSLWFKDYYGEEGPDCNCSDAVIEAYDKYDLKVESRPSNTLPGENSSNSYSDSLVFSEDPEIHLLPLNDYIMLVLKNNLTDSWNDYHYVAFGTTIATLMNWNVWHLMTVRPWGAAGSDIIGEPMTSTYSINFMKVGKLVGMNVMLICCNDGRFLVYELTEDGQLRKYLQIRLTSSVWGVDSQGNYLVVSDNSHTITLFIIEDNHIYYHKSWALEHNIPDVQIISTSPDSVHVTGISISGELANFEFKISWDDKSHRHGKASKAKTLADIDLSNYHPPVGCTITSHISNLFRMKQEGWSVNKIEKSYFKEVSTEADFGQMDLDVTKVLEKSRLLNLSSNHLASSHVGGAAIYEKYFVETKAHSTSLQDAEDLDVLSDKLQHYNQIRKNYMSSNYTEANNDLDDSFLLVTTAEYVGLYTTRTLICNAYSSRISNITDFDRFTEVFDRLSITKVIPELSACIVVSQGGVFCIFRFVKYRGLYSLREEFVKSLLSDDFSPLSGLFVKKVTESQELVYSVVVVNNVHEFFEFTLRESSPTQELTVDALF